MAAQPFRCPRLSWSSVAAPRTRCARCPRLRIIRHVSEINFSWFGKFIKKCFSKKRKKENQPRAGLHSVVYRAQTNFWVHSQKSNPQRSMPMHLAQRLLFPGFCRKGVTISTWLVFHSQRAHHQSTPGYTLMGL